MKTVSKINLSGTPPLLREIFNIISRAGAKHYALFGGAIRDADYGAYHNAPRTINDYDIRIWLPPEQEHAFVTNLGPDVRRVPSAGTGRIRYCLNYNGAELDISVRNIPEQFKGEEIPIEAVAQNRAADSDIGLCSIAIDPSGTAWGTPEYLADRDRKTLSVYPLEDADRKAAYTARMLLKFPDHTVVDLSPA